MECDRFNFHDCFFYCKFITKGYFKMDNRDIWYNNKCGVSTHTHTPPPPV